MAAEEMSATITSSIARLVPSRALGHVNLTGLFAALYGRIERTLCGAPDLTER